ncbi:MAG: Imm7 family immunity protein [Waterburya sp.]|jgi:Immunity protein 7
MYEYHGWFTIEHWQANEKIEIVNKLKIINEPYAIYVETANSQLHIAVSGNPNRDLGYIEEILDYLTSLNKQIYGIVYINDSNSINYNRFEVVKIVKDKIIRMQDNNFTLSETKLLFE